MEIEEYMVESSFMGKLVDIDTPQDLLTLMDNLSEELDEI